MIELYFYGQIELILMVHVSGFVCVCVDIHVNKQNKIY